MSSASARPPATPGQLRRRVTFQQRAAGRDGAWADAYTVWAAIEPLSGRALIAAQAVHAEATLEITLRYRTNVAAGQRAVLGADVYTVLAPPLDTDIRHRWLRLLCSQGVIA
jgi:SPP1 family predicted phage head-tail adaptor